jgi:hypothetical protein
MIKRKVLFIGTVFYNYHTLIQEAMENQGWAVDFYNDRPGTSSLTRAFLKINPKIIQKQIREHYVALLEKINHERYDLVFILNGKAFDGDMVKGLRKAQPQAEFVLYLWDSVLLYPHVREVIPVVDRAYTFDYEDAKSYPELELLPLFYTEEYASIPESSVKVEYDLASICTAHPNRYKDIRELFPKLEEKGLRIFSFYYIMKLQYVYNKLFVPAFRKAKKEEFNFTFLTSKEVVDIIKKSRCIFDIPHDKQTGLTMRTIETLGAKKKLITTNQKVANYNFYVEENIFILKSDNQEEVLPFLAKPYREIPKDIYDSYSLQSWVKRILHKDEKMTYTR